MSLDMAQPHVAYTAILQVSSCTDTSEGNGIFVLNIKYGFTKEQLQRCVLHLTMEVPVP